MTKKTLKEVRAYRKKISRDLATAKPYLFLTESLKGSYADNLKEPFVPSKEKHRINGSGVR